MSKKEKRVKLLRKMEDEGCNKQSKEIKKNYF